MAKYTAIGGQALIEGILMRSPEKTALAVRTPDKGIDISYLEQKSVKDKIKILRLPIIRGVVNFVESMLQGYKAMMLSADKSGFTDLEEEGKKEEAAEISEEDEKKKEKKESAILTAVMLVGSVLGVLLSVALFMYLPRLIVDGISYVFDTELNKVLRVCIEQVIKLAVFVAYVWAVSFMKDIRRVFMYHGAEHKTIFCYEKGLPLTVENVRPQKRLHPRCGTSFMIIMILISIVFSVAIQFAFSDVYDNRLVWTAVKILMIPLVCGAGYEVLRLCGKYDNVFTRIISAPGMWLQKITTLEPDDDMIEIAIAALQACEPENPDVDRSNCDVGLCSIEISEEDRTEETDE